MRQLSQPEIRNLAGRMQQIVSEKLIEQQQVDRQRN
jgi:hypothetical protein